MNHVDSTIGGASDLLIEAKGVALSQIGIGSDAETRENQAIVIDAMLSELIAIGNRQTLDIHLFGGAATADAPFEELLGGLRYVGEGAGIGRLWPHALRAMAIFMPFFFFVDMLSYMRGMTIVVPVAALVVYGLTVYKYVSESVLPLGMLRRSGPRMKVRK